MAEGGQLGKYRIVEELGAGGFATVFKAVDTTLDREVALKILHPPLLADRRFVHNFRQEAKTLAALRHPQIITIYEVGEIEGRIFIAMELARGISLAKAIASRQRIPWEETLALLKPVCEALDYAHEQNVVHRDLKPANLLIDRQRGALLTDFGFAKLLAENAASMSMSGGIVGTPGYIAPEVWENNAADPPVDIYALGCIVYEMLTGNVLFKGQTPIQAMRAHDRGPQLPDAWPEDTPAGIADVLRKALAREAAARYPSAGALWQALNDLEGQARADREAAQRAEAANREAARRAEEAQRDAELRAAVAAEWRAEAERAIDAKEWEAARMAIGRWRAVAPEDAAATSAQARLDQRGRLVPQAATASLLQAEPADRTVRAQAPQRSMPALSPVAATIDQADREDKQSRSAVGGNAWRLVLSSALITLGWAASFALTWTIVRIVSSASVTDWDSKDFFEAYMTSMSLLSLYTWGIAGALGGAVTTFICQRLHPVNWQKKLVPITAGWGLSMALAWLVCMPLARIIDQRLGSMPAFAIYCMPMACVGAVVTSRVAARAYLLLSRSQVLIIAFGWFIALPIAWTFSFSSYLSQNQSFFLWDSIAQFMIFRISWITWALFGVIFGAIGSSVMLWQIYHANRSLNVR